MGRRLSSCGNNETASFRLVDTFRSSEERWWTSRARRCRLRTAVQSVDSVSGATHATGAALAKGDKELKSPSCHDVVRVVSKLHRIQAASVGYCVSHERRAGRSEMWVKSRLLVGH